jgi:hypothetical protein
MEKNIKQYSEKQLILELISKNELAYASSNPAWEKRRKLRTLLYDAGHIICEWDGMREPIAHDGNE